jgi:hypothetical protein
MYTKSPHDVKWFASVSTVEEAKALYRALALRFHPDRGGDAAVMAAIDAHYEAFLTASDGQISRGADGKARTYRYQPAREKALVQVIDQILKLRMPEVDILLIGLYVWVLGPTRAHTKPLRALDLLWHDKRQCWYWRPADLPRACYSGADLGRLAELYGCQLIAS